MNQRQTLLLLMIFALLGISRGNPAIAQGNSALGKSKTLICTGCHARDGNSENPIYPILAGQGAGYLAKQLKDFKSGARKEEHMTPMADAIQAADIPHIAAYFSAQPRKPLPSSTAAPDIGRTLFQEGNEKRGISACAGCHGVDGKGNAPLRFPALAGQHTTYLEKTLKDFRGGMRSNDLDGIMRNNATSLSDAEIAALAAYIASLP